MTTIIVMLVGIILGLIVLVTARRKDPQIDLGALLDQNRSTKTLEAGKRSAMELIEVFKAKHRVDQLMRKDSLSAADSIEIKNIDQQLNHMLHD